MKLSRPRLELDRLLCPWLTLVRFPVFLPLSRGQSLTRECVVFLAGYKFVARLISAAYDGQSGVIEPSYVYVKDDAALQKEIGEAIDFFSVRVELGVSSFPLIVVCEGKIWLTDGLRARATYSRAELPSSTLLESFPSTKPVCSRLPLMNFRDPSPVRLTLPNPSRSAITDRCRIFLLLQRVSTSSRLLSSRWSNVLIRGFISLPSPSVRQCPIAALSFSSRAKKLKNEVKETKEVLKFLRELSLEM